MEYFPDYLSALLRSLLGFFWDNLCRNSCMQNRNHQMVVIHNLVPRCLFSEKSEKIWVQDNRVHAFQGPYCTINQREKSRSVTYSKDRENEMSNDILLYF